MFLLFIITEKPDTISPYMKQLMEESKQELVNSDSDNASSGGAHEAADEAADEGADGVDIHKELGESGYLIEESALHTSQRLLLCLPFS